MISDSDGIGGKQIVIAGTTDTGVLAASSIIAALREHNYSVDVVYREQHTMSDVLPLSITDMRGMSGIHELTKEDLRHPNERLADLRLGKCKWKRS